ncbi:MAG: hypothetical protein HQM06_09840 [Magnetococcales bacterium]|nr:hypothetical protein [Magnetococcales bacterium]
MKRSTVVALMFVMLLLSGCGHYSESTSQVDDRSQLLLTGNWMGTELTIDGKNLMTLTSPNVATDPQAAPPEEPQKRLFAISSGLHRVVIQRNGSKLVDRTLLFTSQTATEVHVP